MEDPAARATRTVTRVASGAMVWRAWGAGPPLVLLHGATSLGREDYAAQLPSMSKAFLVHVPEGRYLKAVFCRVE